ncbi:hypothetical protein FACS1894126_5890 [Alphaproteobacteria bacterium]|nr:hypothetical protein FACS1894126_5890 [Alphaproteobacteria bacterium]
MNKKLRISFLVLFSLGYMVLFATTNDSQEDHENDFPLLNEYVADMLRENGIEPRLRFDGEVNLAMIAINQSIDEGMDENLASLRGHVALKYTQKVDDYALGFEIVSKIRSGVIKSGRAIVDKASVFLESDMLGEFRLGYTNTAADNFSIYGDTYFVGYEGPGSGNFQSLYNASAGIILYPVCTLDDLKAAKIVWKSPTVSGFTISTSYTLDSRDANLFKTVHNYSMYSKNIMTGGGSYECGSDDDFNAKISVVGWLGKGKSKEDNRDVRNLKAYHIGGVIGYKDLKISAGYTDQGRSLLQTESEYLGNEADAGKVYSIGAAYRFDKLTVSGGYFRSVRKFSRNENATADAITAAAEYKFDKFLRVYFEYDNMKTRTCDLAKKYENSSIGDNRANIFMIGTKIYFYTSRE